MSQNIRWLISHFFAAIWATIIFIGSLIFIGWCIHKGWFEAIILLIATYCIIFCAYIITYHYFVEEINHLFKKQDGEVE